MSVYSMSIVRSDEFIKKNPAFRHDIKFNCFLVRNDVGSLSPNSVLHAIRSYLRLQVTRN